MISRRAFLSRMAVTLGAIALAPSVVEALTPAPADWTDEFVDADLIPLEVTKGYGCAMLNDGSYEARPVAVAECVTATSLHSLSPAVVDEWKVRLSARSVGAMDRAYRRRPALRRAIMGRPT